MLASRIFLTDLTRFVSFGTVSCSSARKSGSKNDRIFRTLSSSLPSPAGFERLWPALVTFPSPFTDRSDLLDYAFMLDDGVSSSSVERSEIRNSLLF